MAGGLRAARAAPEAGPVDVIATEALLATGFLERVHAALPGMDECSTPAVCPARRPRVRLRAWSCRPPTCSSQLPATVRRNWRQWLAASRPPGDPALTLPLSRQALIVRRPLPYLYLARSVFGGAGVPFRGARHLPLAAEPFAAALWTWCSTRSPRASPGRRWWASSARHFTFEAASLHLSDQAIGALDRALAEARYLGGLDRLSALSNGWDTATGHTDREGRRRRLARPALDVALDLARSSRPW